LDIGLRRSSFALLNGVGGRKFVSAGCREQTIVWRREDAGTIELTGKGAPALAQSKFFYPVLMESVEKGSFSVRAKSCKIGKRTHDSVSHLDIGKIGIRDYRGHDLEVEESLPLSFNVTNPVVFHNCKPTVLATELQPFCVGYSFVVRDAIVLSQRYKPDSFGSK
jgi:hypothetical protein